MSELHDDIRRLNKEVDDLENRIEELEQDIEEYERRLSVSNETIDIYEKLVKHVETQRDDLYQELQSNEMFIKELKNQKAELIEFVKDIVDYEAERVLREREKLLNKYK
jgi:cell division septum initiation protein DivIVA